MTNMTCRQWCCKLWGAEGTASPQLQIKSNQRKICEGAAIRHVQECQQ